MFGAQYSGVGVIFAWQSRLNAVESVSLSDSPENRLRELTCPRLNSREATVAAEGHNGFSPRLQVSGPVLVNDDINMVKIVSGLGLQVEVFELRRPILASDQKRRSRCEVVPPSTSSQRQQINV